MRNDFCGASGGELPRVARWSIEAALRGDPVEPPRPAQGLLSEKRGVFVTVWKRPRQLRGCVGALEPKCATLLEETWRVARQAAFSDGRFAPITVAEVPTLSFKISVLNGLQTVQTAEELDPSCYGVVVRTRDGRRGALLPGLEKVDTALEQIRIARRKGGIGETEAIVIERFSVEVFEEAAE